MGLLRSLEGLQQALEEHPGGLAGVLDQFRQTLPNINSSNEGWNHDKA